MNYNDVYNQRYDKIKDTIAFKNEHVGTIYMGHSTPAAEEGMTLAEYVANPDSLFEHYLHYINRLNAIGHIDGLNRSHGAYINVALATMWWSYIKMPGRELPANSIWQVEEKTRITAGDYDFIIEKGKDAMFQKLLPQLFSQEDWQGFMAYQKGNLQTNQRYIDEGYPIVSTGTVCPPFETLCGARGMNEFFMDCYKMPDKVKETQDVMMKTILQQVEKMPQEKYFIGSWVGGWRGASSMVNQKIWDKLVWPYIKEAALLLIERGLTPVMHLDACWDRDIERFKELPAKKIILNTDGMTDLRRARKLLGDHAAFMGDVPVQMLAVSSKEEVADYTKTAHRRRRPAGTVYLPRLRRPGYGQI